MAKIDRESYFDLPVSDQADVLQKLLLSLGVTLLAVILVVKWLEHAHPEIEVYLLTIPPLLSVIAFVILALVYWLIKTLVDLSAPKTRQDGA